MIGLLNPKLLPAWVIIRIAVFLVFAAIFLPPFFKGATFPSDPTLSQSTVFLSQFVYLYFVICAGYTTGKVLHWMLSRGDSPS